MDGDINSQTTATANTDGGRRQGTKRKKYAAKACYDCKRRKVRCSGDDICQQCYSREVRCCYSPPPPPQSFSGDHDEETSSDPPYTSNSFAAVPQAASQDNRFYSAVASIPATSSVTAATIPDPRIDGLCDRVRALERMLNHVLKSPKSPEDTSPSPPFQLSLWSTARDEEDDANQFAARGPAHGDLTLSSQVADMSTVLSRPPSPRPGNSSKQSVRGDVLVEFPDPSTLQHLLDVYFRDLDNYFPFLDRQETESCIYSVIRRLGYSPYNLMLVVTTDDLSVIALTCMMLALAECLDTRKGACDGDAKPGWNRYIQCCRAMQHSSQSRTVDLHIVGAQCLVSAYLMQCEALGAASEAMSVTWKLAALIRLNDSKSWPPGDTKRTLQHQKLWWVIYFLDRQISRRSGTAYHIRDTEFNVDDFSTESNVVDGNLGPEGDWQSSVTKYYLQALVSSAKLWSHVWDTFFAVGATKKGDRMEIEITDARILHTRRQLSNTLHWNADELENYSSSGEDEPHIRRRMQVFTRLELLRMLIRQNPVRRTEFNPETAHLCARLSREIIRSHDLYITKFPEARAVGYFTTSSVVECVYHLANVLRYSEDSDEHTACKSAFNLAQSILVRLSVYNNVAKKALKALNGLAKRWGTGKIADKNGGDPAHDTELFESRNFNDVAQHHAQMQDLHGINTQIARGGFDTDMGWMNVSMDTLYGTEFDFRLDTQL